MEAQPPNLARGKAADRVIFLRRCVHEIQLAHTIFVGHECQRLAVVAELKVVDVPFDVGGEIHGLHRGQVEIGQPLEFRIAVRCGVEAFAVLAERGPVVSDFNIARLRRQ